MATPDYDQVLKNNQEAASLSAKAAQEARDAYNQIINTKAVGTSGQLRALSAADTLSDAPVGDAAKLRSNIGAQEATSMMALEIGGELWQVRQRLGLGNDDAGRNSVGLGADNEVRHKKVVVQGAEVDYVDWHKLGGDDSDYQARMICDSAGVVSAIGKFDFSDLRINGQAVGDLAKANVGYNTYGSVMQKLIGDVPNKGFGAGTLCAAGAMNGWDDSADNIYITGTWLCTSQVRLPSEGKWLCTFIKCGN